jgi:RimJ/RimL family protein N-acetyltransferase
MHPFLETDRLIFRPFTLDDLDKLVELDSDPEVMRFLSGGAPTPREMIEREVLPRFIEATRRHPEFGYFAAMEKSSGDFVGSFGLSPEKGGPGDVSLGYRLRRAAWGKGYGTEGARALIARAFQQPDVRRVIATTYEENLASRRVMEKAGMTLVRRFRMTPVQLASEGTYDSSAGVIWPGEDVEYAIEKAEWERRSGR